MRSDNNSGISPEILQAIIDENNGDAEAYGRDDLTARSEAVLQSAFECEDLKAFNLISGTAANSLIIATLSPTFGAVFCHQDSHVNGDECGANEFQSGGAKLVPLKGRDGKITGSELEEAIDWFTIGEPHHSQPSMLSIAQSTEAGTVYSPDEIHDLSTVLKKHNLKLHMDGARFANAVAKIGCSPAEMTWKAGVDALSFGSTKNGTLGAEAAIFFNGCDDGSFIYRRMRSGHLLSKMRFVSAQIIAYLENDLWLKNATHANLMAEKLYQGVKNSDHIKFSFPVQSNVMFAEIEDQLREKLSTSGFQFYSKKNGDISTSRLVTAFNTSPELMDEFIEIVRALNNKPL
ncbi:MAG: low specificity L-threonine aldolase [Kordiimonadaceae bacterium]|jgi:threonine aldolase|nr:low specificity L-threonine aldolase [Kordiimonadaceae bacterium]MBT6035116.1 low specificity L-threonine aldolase [Kordiimonadaceae bacterium]MBT6329648.1 low specificity L-threonine aldolase [Kordiimonadaceae bacterium]